VLNKKIKETSEKYFHDAIKFLREVVDINSDSNNIEGCNDVGERVISYFKKLGFYCEDSEDGTRRKYYHLFNRTGHDSAYLCLGHLDTVFPEEQGFNAFNESQGVGYGPGVIDMKGGVITLWLALKILKEIGYLEKIPFRLLFNSDEEIGSASVIDLFSRVKPVTLGIFNFEAARDSGALVKARKGVGDFRIIVKGRAAHSGSHFTLGVNAINEIAHKIIGIAKIVDIEKGITVSPGIVNGGRKVNVVPDFAEVIFDLRFKNNSQKDYILTQLDKIVRESFIPGTEAELSGGFSRPAFSATEKVLEAFKYFHDSARELFQIDLKAEETGGAADINFFGELNIPMLDGLGPCGGKDHTTEEFIVLSSIMERAAIFAKSIINLNNDRSGV